MSVKLDSVSAVACSQLLGRIQNEAVVNERDFSEYSRKNGSHSASASGCRSATGL